MASSEAIPVSWPVPMIWGSSVGGGAGGGGESGRDIMSVVMEIEWRRESVFESKKKKTEMLSKEERTKFMWEVFLVHFFMLRCWNFHQKRRVPFTDRNGRRHIHRTNAIPFFGLKKAPNDNKNVCNLENMNVFGYNKDWRMLDFSIGRKK